MGFTTCIGYDKERLLKSRLETKTSKVGENGVYDEWKVLAHSLRGNNLWYVVERTTYGPGYKSYYRFIALDLIGYDRRNNGWGYKDVSEHMGLNEKDCPLKFFDMVPEPCDSPHAHGWRQKVREWHSASAAQRRKMKEINPQPGEKWMLREGMVDRATRTHKLHTVWIGRVNGSKIVGTANDGETYRFAKRHLVERMGEKQVATLEEMFSDLS